MSSPDDPETRAKNRGKGSLPPRRRPPSRAGGAPPRRSSSPGAAILGKGTASQPGQGPPSEPPDSPHLVQQGRGAVVPSFDFRIDFAAGSRRGPEKEVNQDAVRCFPASGLFTLADGMGGHPAGEVASVLCLETIHEELRREASRKAIEAYALSPELEHRRALYDLLTSTTVAAHRAVRAEGERDPAKKGMGTTVDFTLLVRDRGFFAHVGDSRAYLVRPTATLQLTHDHAAYDTLRTSGKRVPRGQGGKSPLSNSIGHREELTVDTLYVDLAVGDRIVLVTDGAFEGFEDDDSFSAACRAGETPEEVVASLLATADAQEVRDDASAVVVFVGERFTRHRADPGLRNEDIATLRNCPLFLDLSNDDVLAALAAGVEVDYPEGKEVPRAVANDRAAFIVIEGMVKMPSGRYLGPSALLHVESLLDVPNRGPLPEVVERTRMLRIRHDDFVAVCGHDDRLAAQLYRRIAMYFAQMMRDP